MVLPKSLMKIYNEQLSFYACTVSNFEQYTLAKFINNGFFEKHINRMRNYYRAERDTILNYIKNQKYYDKMEIREEHAGLHFLLYVDTKYDDDEIIKRAAANGIHISVLSQYFNNRENAMKHILVINYSGIASATIREALERLFESIW